MAATAVATTTIDRDSTRESTSLLATSSTFARWTPSMPTNLLTLLNPFSGSNDDAADKSGTDSGVRAPRSARPGFFEVSTSSKAPPSPNRSASMFAEPDTRSTSEAGSREGSVDGSRRARRNSRPKTAFSICHPPPTSTARSKLHRRPRSLLQLHRLRGQSRPMPAFEVIPSVNFSVHLTRAITRVYKARHGLCANDLVVLKAEKYSSEEEEEEDDDTTRRVIGLICKGRRDEDRSAGLQNGSCGGKMRICMASGREWEAYALSNGGYEFFSTDEHGLGMTLRWVPKRSKDGSKVTMKDGTRRFNFSTISPHTRKHPVIATLSKTGLEVFDSYKLPDPSAMTPLSSPQQNAVLADVMEEDGEQSSRDICVTDDPLREVITMTAIWVTFREGWSPSFRYDDKDVSGMASSASPSKTTVLEAGTPPASPLLSPEGKRGSIRSLSSSIARRTSLLSKTSHASVAAGIPRAGTFPAEDLESTRSGSPSRPGSISHSGRTRADSTSTVLVHRAASNRRRDTAQSRRLSELLSTEDGPDDRKSNSIRAPSPTKVFPKDSPHRRARSDGAAKTLFVRATDENLVLKPAAHRKSMHADVTRSSNGSDSDDSEDSLSSADDLEDDENDPRAVDLAVRTAQLKAGMLSPTTLETTPATTPTSGKRRSALFSLRIPRNPASARSDAGDSIASSNTSTPTRSRSQKPQGWRKLLYNGPLKGMASSK